MSLRFSGVTWMSLVIIDLNDAARGRKNQSSWRRIKFALKAYLAIANRHEGGYLELRAIPWVQRASMSLLTESVVFLGAAVVAVPLAKRLGLGSVLGYLAAGAVIGPWALDWSAM